jgi:hypothetical protein
VRATVFEDFVFNCRPKFTDSSLLQVAYFKVSRNLIVEGSRLQHKDGVERLREAREFAEWSYKDREARLPKLTNEQSEQMQNYLQLVGRHGLSKTFSDASQCEGCPIVGRAKKGSSFSRE